MIEFSNCIPLGMHRSVERRNTLQKQHPVRDASLTGCTERSVRTFSTERNIPIGMSKTVICFFIFHEDDDMYYIMCIAYILFDGEKKSFSLRKQNFFF